MPRRAQFAVAVAVSVVASTSCGENKPPTAPETNATTGVEGFRTRGELRHGYILRSDGRPRAITFEVHGGLAVIEGDILLGPASAIPATIEELRNAPPRVPFGPSFGVVIDGSNYRWPGGVVPYEIDPALPNQGRVTQAIAKIEATTPSVDLVPRSGQAAYVRFVPSSGCSSYVGRIGGMQPINLEANCSTGNTIHEITHALGFWHEQSRCDRDSYVQILYANIIPGQERNFDAHCLNATDLFEYAEGSIMHYPPTAFTVNGQPTIRSLRGLDNLMGQRSGYGPTDIKTINDLYPPKNSAWMARPSMTTARKQVASAGANGSLYVIGGASGPGTPQTKVEAFNPTTNAWTTKASLPAARWRWAGAGVVKNVVYVSGGQGTGASGVQSTLYAYKPSTNKWSLKAPMPVAGGCGGAGVVSDILYVLVGCDVHTSTNSGATGILLRYDPATNSWTVKAPSPAAHQYPGVTAISGKLYVVGGRNSSGAATTTLHVYDPANNTWSTKAPLPSPRYSLLAQGVGGKLYAIGGNDAAGGFTNTVYVYDPAANSWSVGSPMPTARATHGGAAINKVIYVAGGYNLSSAALAANEALTP